MPWEHRDSFADEAGEWTLISRGGVENGALFELWCEPQCSFHMGMRISGTFLRCMKGVKYPFAFLEEEWDFSGDTALEKGLILR